MSETALEQIQYQPGGNPMRSLKYVSFIALLATIFAANWSLQRWGIVPIGFGLMAPAGVFFAGLAFGLRDVLHETGGRGWVIAAILIGAALAYFVAPSFAVPSAVAFLFSETADFLVYDPLRLRHWTWAVVASNAVGAIVDSALFLMLAFGSVEFMAGQVIGKTYMTALALPVVWWTRRRVVPSYSL